MFESEHIHNAPLQTPHHRRLLLRQFRSHIFRFFFSLYLNSVLPIDIKPPECLGNFTKPRNEVPFFKMTFAGVQSYCAWTVEKHKIAISSRLFFITEFGLEIVRMLL